MTLSYSKFMLSGTDMEQADIRCTVCGRSEESDYLRLDDAIEWAESHECAGLRVTIYSLTTELDGHMPNCSRSERCAGQGACR